MTRDLVEAAREMTWHRAYERASVERYLEQAQAERSRLLGEIEEADRRVAAAQAGAGAPDLMAQARIGSLVLDAHRQLEDAVRENQHAVAAIEAEADVEVARILAAARAEVRSIRQTSWVSEPGVPPDRRRGRRATSRLSRGARGRSLRRGRLL